MKLRILLLAFIPTFTYSQIHADTFSIGIFSARNKGEYVVQLYNGGETAVTQELLYGQGQSPDLLMFLYHNEHTGSSIIMDRNYAFYGVTLGHEKPRLTSTARIYSTFYTVDSGRLKDFDYTCGCDKGPVRMSLPIPKWAPIRIKDTAYRSNFPSNQITAYAEGKSKLNETGIEL